MLSNELMWALNDINIILIQMIFLINAKRKLTD